MAASAKAGTKCKTAGAVCEVSGILCEVFFSNKLDIMVVFFPGGDVLQRYSELEIY